MQLGLSPLFEQLERAPALDYVLATVVDTRGSSYRKAGAMMLLMPGHEPLGMVSGGCLEGDLMAHGDTVRAERRARRVHYDLTADDAALWGLGLGCGGAIDILLEPAWASTGFAGLSAVHEHWLAGRFCWWERGVEPEPPTPSRVHTTTSSLSEQWTRGDATPSLERATRVGDQLLIPVSPPPRLLVCGAGADAVPVVALARQMAWRVTLVDHRPSLAVAARFAHGTQLALCESDNVAAEIFAACDAAVIMSHHLERDAMFVRRAMASSARYVGLLGPAARREDVVARAGITPDGRLYGPAGLNIGANLPETIALSILAQAQAVLAGRSGGAFE